MLPRLIEMVRGKDQALQLSALEARPTLGPLATPAVEDVIKAAHSPAEEVRREALQALHSMGSKVEGVAPALLQTAISGSESDRSRAMSFLAKLKPPTPELLGILLPLFNHKEDYVRSGRQGIAFLQHSGPRGGAGPGITAEGPAQVGAAESLRDPGPTAAAKTVRWWSCSASSWRIGR